MGWTTIPAQSGQLGHRTTCMERHQGGKDWHRVSVSHHCWLLATLPWIKPDPGSSSSSESPLLGKTPEVIGFGSAYLPGLVPALSPCLLDSCLLSGVPFGCVWHLPCEGQRAGMDHFASCICLWSPSIELKSLYSGLFKVTEIKYLSARDEYRLISLWIRSGGTVYSFKNNKKCLLT